MPTASAAAETPASPIHGRLTAEKCQGNESPDGVASVMTGIIIANGWLASSEGEPPGRLSVVRLGAPLQSLSVTHFENALESRGG